MKKIAYVIGRFQPFHNGHKAMIDKALEIADEVVVIIGDTGCRPDFKNPWTVAERQIMIVGCYTRAEAARLRFLSVEDQPYDDEAWTNSVHAAINRANADAGSLPWERFLVGFKKDASSFYLKLFPEWQFVGIDPVLNAAMCGNPVLDATKIRESYFGLHGGGWNWKYHLPFDVVCILNEWAKDEMAEFSRIRDEYEAIQKHNMEWDCIAVRKYGGPVIAAVDALLHTDEEVLLIRRGKGVGKGALALPGGFVDPSERLLDAALRELHEETGIRLDKRDFDSRPGALIPFDHPGRSMRGRIITNVLKAKVPGAVANFPPTAGDDASEALWVKKADLLGLKREFFADHFHIINTLLN